MKDFLKYLGSIFILIGVAILVFYYFSNTPSNIMLGTAGAIMIVGLITHIVINKQLE